MVRNDLMALCEDDLVTLANRGLFNRAQRELKNGAPAGHVTENQNGDVTVQWDDGVVCQLNAGQRLDGSMCSCPSTQCCRHLIRSVLLYQQHVQAPMDQDTAQPQTDQPPPPLETAPWDPGQIDDQELARHYTPAQQKKLRVQFEQGVIAQLNRSAKPTALFHNLSLCVRFLVPGQLAYTHCDCREAAPCRHALWAVWAFRQVPPNQHNALISTLPPPVIETQTLDEIENFLMELAQVGLGGLSEPLVQRLQRLEAGVRAKGLIWPAEILSDMLEVQRRYSTHDARFDPVHVSELIGELCVRIAALREPACEVPPVFICGSRADHTTEVGASRLLGLGCHAAVQKGGVRLTAFLQDVDSSMTCAVTREYEDPDPAPGRPRPSIEHLAQRHAIAQHSLASLGTGQLLVKNGKRTPNATFIAGRGPHASHPQDPRWETLRPPVLAQSFSQLQQQLAMQPPAALRPRRLMEDFFVCPVAGATQVRFDRVEQAIVATLQDAQSGQAVLYHPFLSRAQASFETALSALQAHPEQLRFVSGTAKIGRLGLTLRPAALVFDDGKHRSMISPWTDLKGDSQERMQTSERKPEPKAFDPVFDFQRQIQDELGALFVQGTARVNTHMVQAWGELARRAQSYGFLFLLEPIQAIAQSLQSNLSRLERDHRTPCAQALRLAMLQALTAAL